MISLHFGNLCLNRLLQSLAVFLWQEQPADVTLSGMYWILDVNNHMAGERLAPEKRRERCEGGGGGGRGRGEGSRGGGEKCIVARPNSDCLKEAYKNSECMCSFQVCRVRCSTVPLSLSKLDAFFLPFKELHLTQKFANCRQDRRNVRVRWSGGHMDTGHSQMNW